IEVYYFDWFSASNNIIETMEQYGFKSYKQACCGIPEGDFNCVTDNNTALCGCGSPSDTVFNNPSECLLFDGTHFTQ
ncbi:hypothetical protein SELMODRAFT_70966, partial [Selaginella moellendorffii]